MLLVFETQRGSRSDRNILSYFKINKCKANCEIHRVYVMIIRYKVPCKSLSPLVFPPKEMFLSQLFISFVSVGNTKCSLLPLIVIFHICMHKEYNNS